MPSPFPGMNPWLEDPVIWSDVHTSLAVRLREIFAPQLLPRYYVAVEQRTYLAQPDELVFVGRPDLSVVGILGAPLAPEGGLGFDHAPQVVTLPVPEERVERFLEVRDAGSGEVITVLEILSPANKVPGRGREEYEAKRAAVLGTRTHLVEVDLLRIGRPPARNPEAAAGCYGILVSRAWRRPRAELYAFGVRDPIPQFPLPLRRGEPEIAVDLKAALEGVYDAAHYDLRLRYAVDPAPPLSAGDLAWARERARSPQQG